MTLISFDIHPVCPSFLCLIILILGDRRGDSNGCTQFMFELVNCHMIIIKYLPYLVYIGVCFQIRVNSVNPTLVLTPLGMKGSGTPEKQEAMKSIIPLARLAGIKQFFLIIQYGYIYYISLVMGKPDVGLLIYFSDRFNIYTNTSTITRNALH